MGDMRVTLPLLRIPHARARILRYGVAVLSTALALIPTVLLADVSESRLALFGVAIMVSAWYGGWKPGLVATSFALTKCVFHFRGRTYPGGVAHRDYPSFLVLLRGHADLRAQRRVAGCAGESPPVGAQLPLSGHQRPLWHLPLRRDGQGSRRQSRIPRDARLLRTGGSSRSAHPQPLR